MILLRECRRNETIPGSRCGALILACIAAFCLTANASPQGKEVPEILPRWQQEVPVSACSGIHYAIDGRVGAGVLVRRVRQLISFTAEGAVRWQASVPCSARDAPRWENAILTPDGGAWAIASGPDYYQYVLQRFDTQGQISTSIALDFDVRDGDLVLFGDDHEAVIVMAGRQMLEWQRFDAASGIVQKRTHVLGDLTYKFQSARLLGDGGVGVTFFGIPCDMGTCPPDIAVYRLDRLASDGDLLWQVEGGGGLPLPDAQGGVDILGLGVNYRDPPRYLRRVTPAGEIGPDVALSGIDGELHNAYGAHADRVTLLTIDENDTNKLWSLDRAGNAVASRRFESHIYVVDNSPLGLLVEMSDGDPSCLWWIDPLTLQSRACFRLDQAADSYGGFGGPQFLTDGTLYTRFSIPTDGEDPRIILAHFDAPPAGGAERRQRAITARAQLREQR